MWCKAKRCELSLAFLSTFQRLQRDGRGLLGSGRTMFHILCESTESNLFLSYQPRAVAASDPIKSLQLRKNLGCSLGARANKIHKIHVLYKFKWVVLPLPLVLHILRWIPHFLSTWSLNPNPSALATSFLTAAPATIPPAVATVCRSRGIRSLFFFCSSSPRIYSAEHHCKAGPLKWKQTSSCNRQRCISLCRWTGNLSSPLI